MERRPGCIQENPNSPFVSLSHDRPPADLHPSDDSPSGHASAVLEDLTIFDSVLRRGCVGIASDGSASAGPWEAAELGFGCGCWCSSAGRWSCFRQHGWPCGSRYAAVRCGGSKARRLRLVLNRQRVSPSVRWRRLRKGKRRRTTTTTMALRGRRSSRGCCRCSSKE